MLACQAAAVPKLWICCAHHATRSSPLSAHLPARAGAQEPSCRPAAVVAAESQELTTLTALVMEAGLLDPLMNRQAETVSYTHLTLPTKA